MAGYRIYHTSRRQDPGNADADASRVVSAVARRFLAIPASSATSEHLFWRLVGCRLALKGYKACVTAEGIISNTLCN